MAEQQTGQDEFLHGGQISDMTAEIAALKKQMRELFAAQQGGGGSGGWDPDKPPASPGALDDEFSDNSLNVAWSEYDPEGKTTWTEGDGGAKATIVTTATDNHNGIYKTLPAGAFTAIIKVATLSLEAHRIVAGIALWENPAGNNKMAMIDIDRDGTANFVTRLEMVEFTNHTTYSSHKIALTTIGYSEQVYLRLRRTGTNYYAEFSFNGLGWRSLNAGAAVTLGFTPTAIGLDVNNLNSGVTISVIYPFFRYIASDVGIGGVLAGNR